MLSHFPKWNSPKISFCTITMSNVARGEICILQSVFPWQAHPDEVHLLVAVVNYKTKLVKPRRGLCSTWLTYLDSSNKELRVPVWVKKGTIAFPKAVDAPCLMIGPGTSYDGNKYGHRRNHSSWHVFEFDKVNWGKVALCHWHPTSWRLTPVAWSS